MAGSFTLPTAITISDVDFKIRNKGDYRVVLDCFSALQDIDLPKRNRLITAVVMFYDGFCLENVMDILDTDEKLKEAVEKMYDFFACGQHNIGSRANHKLIDWEQDEHMIASAVNKVAGMEVRSVKYMHWWTFMGYYCGVGESILSSVVSIRSKLLEGKQLEKHEKEFRRNNPEYFVWNHQSVEDREAEALLRQLWEQE